jgi:hypothetical protein
MAGARTAATDSRPNWRTTGRSRRGAKSPGRPAVLLQVIPGVSSRLGCGTSPARGTRRDALSSCAVRFAPAGRSARPKRGELREGALRLQHCLCLTWALPQWSPPLWSPIHVICSNDSFNGRYSSGTCSPSIRRSARTEMPRMRPNLHACGCARSPSTPGTRSRRDVQQRAFSRYAVATSDNRRHATNRHKERS